MALTALLYTRPSENVTVNATITASAADASYPAANLGDLDPSKPAKLTTTSGNWVFDYGSAQRVDVFALIHHNLTAGLDVKLQGNATNSWGAPTLSTAITIPTYHEDGFPVNPWLDVTGVSGYSTSGFRFWRLLINAASGANVAIGEVVMATTKRQLETNISRGAEDRDEHPTIEHRTLHGVSRIYDLGTKIRRLTCKVTAKDTGFASLQSLARGASVRVKPFLIVRDTSVNDAWFVRLGDTSFSQTLPYVGRHEVPLVFEELSRGLVL